MHFDNLLAGHDGVGASTYGAANSGAIGAKLVADAGVAVIHELFAIPIFHTIVVTIGLRLVARIEGAGGKADAHALARVALVGVGTIDGVTDTIVLAGTGIDDGLDDNRWCQSAIIAICFEDGTIDWRALSIGLIAHTKEASRFGGGVGEAGFKGCADTKRSAK